MLALLADGIDNRGVAAALKISERAAKMHVGALFETFKVERRTELALISDRAGIRRTHGPRAVWMASRRGLEVRTSRK